MTRTVTWTEYTEITTAAADLRTALAPLLRLVRLAWEASPAQPGEGSVEEAAIDAAVEIDDRLECIADGEDLEIDGDRPWLLSWCDESGYEEQIPTCSLAEARRIARERAREGWEPCEETWWLDIEILCPVTREAEGTVTVQIDPTEPTCTEATHDWEDDGMPGFGAVVTGHGGGVILRERCRHCGCTRTTDTWAQRMDTGEQGLRSVSYAAAED